MSDLPIFPGALEQDIILPEYIAEYKAGMAFLYRELKILHVNIYLIEKILGFPLKLFTDEIPDKAIFLSYFLNNAIDKCILTITNLVAKRSRNSRDIYSFVTFQAKVANFVKPEYRNALQERIKENELSVQLSDIYQRMKRLRDKRIVHLTQDFYDECYDNSTTKNYLYLREIKELCKKLHFSFHNLSFGSEYIMLYPCYWDNHPQSHKSDIEEILDSIAYNSYIFHMPEKDPERWLYLRSSLRREDLDILNKYRKKLSKSVV